MGDLGEQGQQVDRGGSTSCRVQFIHTIVLPRNALAASWLLARALDLSRELSIAQTTAGLLPPHALRCRHGSQENALFFFSRTFETFNDMRVDRARRKRGSGEQGDDAYHGCPFDKFRVKADTCRSVVELVGRLVAQDRGLCRSLDAFRTTPFWEVATCSASCFPRTSFKPGVDSRLFRKRLGSYCMLGCEVFA